MRRGKKLRRYSKKNRRMRIIRKRVNNLLVSLSIIAALGLTGKYIATQLKSDYDIQKDNDALAFEMTSDDLATETEEASTELTVSEKPEETESIEPDIAYPNVVALEQNYEASADLLDAGYEFLNVDFDSLKEINNDACAWLVLDGTNINLPIVQGEDNDYYLHHDIYGAESKAGTIFEDYHNTSLDNETADLSDFTYIFGHHMRGRLMFASIVDYKKQSTYDKMPYAILYTPEATYKAEFFAGLIIDGADDANLYTSDFVDADMYDLYIEYLKSNSTFVSDVTPELGDKVIVLVTCSYEQNNNRYALYARLNKQLTKNIEEEKGKVKTLTK